MNRLELKTYAISLVFFRAFRLIIFFIESSYRSNSHNIITNEIYILLKI